MKLATFIHEQDLQQTPRLGVLSEDAKHLVDLQAAAVALEPSVALPARDMRSLLELGEPGFQRIHDLFRRASESPDAPRSVFPRLDQVRWLAPLPVPASIRDCMVFKQHLVQATRAVIARRLPPLAWLDRGWERLTRRSLLPLPGVWRRRPLYYKGNPRSVVGHESKVHWPRYTQQLDFELEIGVFIGRRGRDIPFDQASQYIAGYTIFNDFSARDVQLDEMRGRLGPAKGKDFDTGNVLGPYLVTPDEIPDVYDLRMTVRVNGQVWGQGNSGQMQHRFEDIIAYVSQSETLWPGDFIAAGTVGNGCGLELNRWLKPGDVVELEIDHLGVLRNQVVQDEHGVL